MTIKPEDFIPAEPGFYWADWYGADAVVEVIRRDNGTNEILAPGLQGKASPHAFRDWRGPIEPLKKADRPADATPLQDGAMARDEFTLPDSKPRATASAKSE